MLRNGNNELKKAVCFILLISMVFILTSCPAITDWGYKLSGNYAAMEVNSYRVVFGTLDEKNKDFETLIESYVYGFCYSDTYIGIMRLPVDDDKCYKERISIDTFDRSNMEYYLVDVANHEILGPYGPSQYYDLCDKLETGYIGDWIYSQDLITSSVPEERRF